MGSSYCKLSPGKFNADDYFFNSDLLLTLSVMFTIEIIFLEKDMSPLYYKQNSSQEIYRLVLVKILSDIFYYTTQSLQMDKKIQKRCRNGYRYYNVVVTLEMVAKQYKKKKCRQFQVKFM